LRFWVLNTIKSFTNYVVYSSRSSILLIWVWFTKLFYLQFRANNAFQTYTTAISKHPAFNCPIIYQFGTRTETIVARCSSGSAVPEYMCAACNNSRDVFLTWFPGRFNDLVFSLSKIMQYLDYLLLVVGQFNACEYYYYCYGVLFIISLKLVWHFGLLKVMFWQLNSDYNYNIISKQ